MRSPASRRWWQRPAGTWPWPPSTERWPSSPTSPAPRSSSPNPRRCTRGDAELRHPRDPGDQSGAAVSPGRRSGADHSSPGTAQPGGGYSVADLRRGGWERGLLPRRPLRGRRRQRPGHRRRRIRRMVGGREPHGRFHSGARQRLAERRRQRPGRPHRDRGRRVAARRDLPQGGHAGHRRRRRGDVRLHGPVRAHPDRRRRGTRTRRLPLRGGDLRGRGHRLARVRRRHRGDDRRGPPGSEGTGPRDRVRPRRPGPRDQGGLGPPPVPLLDAQSRGLLMEPRSFEPAVNRSFPPDVIGRIHEMADTGQYPIRGLGARRPLPSFDDLVFLTASISRYPLEGYREQCETRTVLGGRHGAQPLELEIPITIAGMSFGALSATAKEALGRAATAVGTSTTTGDGGMTPEERKASALLVYQVLPSRYGFDPADLRQADAVEIVVGQGAKPGGGGMLLGQKVNARVAAMRTLPPGIDQRSASRHPDWVGPDDLRIKIEELREATEWSVPIYVKVGATRVDHDVKLAVAAGADVVVVDGMQGGTAATQEVFIEHAGIPTLPAVRLAAAALEELGMQDQVQLVVSGGIRSGADVAKALALGADAVSVGVAALLALGCNRRTYRSSAGDLVNVEDDYAALS